MKNPKQEYKYTMGMYIMTVELPNGSWINKDALFSFQALTVPYKKASGNLHLKTWSKEYNLPNGIDRISPYWAFEFGFPVVIDTTDGCMPPTTRKRHWYLCFPEISDQNEAIARQKFLVSLDNFRNSEYRNEVASKIRRYRFDAKFLTESRELLIGGFEGKGKLIPLHDRRAVLYWLGRRGDPVFEYCEYEYYVDRDGTVHSDSRFGMETIRESNFGKALMNYTEDTAWIILKERDDALALSLLKERYKESTEFHERRVSEKKTVLKAAAKFLEAKLR